MSSRRLITPELGSGSQRHHTRTSSMETVKIDTDDQDWDLMEPLSPQTSPFEVIYLVGGHPRVTRHNPLVAGLEPKNRELSSTVKASKPTLSDVGTSTPPLFNIATTKQTTSKPIVSDPATSKPEALCADHTKTHNALPVNQREETGKKYEERVKKYNKLETEFTKILNFKASAPANYTSFPVRKPHHATPDSYKSFKPDIPLGERGYFTEVPSGRAPDEKMLKQGNTEATRDTYSRPSITLLSEPVVSQSRINHISRQDLMSPATQSSSHHLQAETAPGGFSESQKLELKALAQSALEEARYKRLLAEKKVTTTKQHYAARKYAQDTLYSDNPWKLLEEHHILSPPATPPGQNSKSLLGPSKAAKNTMTGLESSKLMEDTRAREIARKREIAHEIQAAQKSREVMEKKEAVEKKCLAPGPRKTIESIFMDKGLQIDGDVPVMFTDVSTGVIPNLKVDAQKGRITYTCPWTGNKVTEDGWGLSYFCPHSTEKMMTRFSTPAIAMGHCCEDKLGFNSTFDRFSSW